LGRKLEKSRGAGHISPPRAASKTKRAESNFQGAFHMDRILKAIKAFFAVLGGVELVPASEAKREKSAAPAPKTVALPVRKEEPKGGDFEAGAVYALSLLQREGRLVDFLQEDLSSCADSQIGSAARQIHDNCAKVLKERFGVAPVSSAQEGAPLSVPENFDPCEFKLTGNVPEGQAPGEGTLMHKGWKAAKIELPLRSGRVKPEIICQAEVGYR
jgi:hypothetical protein